MEDQPRSLDYRLGKIEGQLTSLNAKMDIMLVLSKQETDARIACREHCDKEMPVMDSKIDSMKWKVAAVAGAEIALLGALLWVIKAHVGG